MAMTLPLARRASRLTGSVIDSSTELLAQQTHDVVRFAMGAPSEDLLPMADLDEAFARSGPSRYDYGESAGEPRLRDEVVKLSLEMGVETANNRIVITNGAMQGLDLAFKLLVDPGDLVIVESPTYTNGYQTAKSYEAHVISAPVDEYGLIVEALPEIVEREGRTPKAIYTIPNFQNPTGVTLPEKRKLLLLELAEKWGAVIIEDDPYRMLRFAGTPVPSFGEISPGNPLIFSVQTFSKVIAPGLRVGWIDVDPELQRLAVNAKQAIDTCTNVPNQLAIADFLAGNKLHPHIKRLLPLYRERKVAMIEAVTDTFGESVEYTQPEGGFFLWASFQNDYSSINTEELLPAAIAQGVAYIPGAAFTIDGSLRNALRLCFATSSPERIREGINRLGVSVRQHAAA